MKKLLFITLGLAALFGVTACVEQQNVSPNFNPVDQTINTEFVFNISSIAGDANPGTKQLDSSVQAHGNFRGIDNATLFAIIDSTMSTSTNQPARKMVVPTTNAQAMRDLSSILQQSALSDTAHGGTRIIEINLPVGTNQLVFYAKAAKENKAPLDSKELYGSLAYTTTQSNYINLADMIGSYAERRLAKKDSIPFENMQTLIVKTYNGLFSTGVNCTTAWYDTTLSNSTIVFQGGVPDSYTVTLMHWADYAMAADDAHPYSPYFYQDGQGNIYTSPAEGRTRATASELEKILGKAYVSFASENVPGEVRAGSGSSAARGLSDLYNIVSAGAQANPVNLQEKVSQIIYKKLTSTIEKLTDPVVNSLTGERVWKTPSVVKSVVGETGMILADTYNITRFPEEMHLPLGSVTIGLDSIFVIPASQTATGADARILRVKYTSSLDTLLNGRSSNGNLYTYPPELCYYGNSSIRVNNTNNNKVFPSSYSVWYNNDSWEGNGWLADGSSISNETRAIALTNTIQYGVALLASRVIMDGGDYTDNGLSLAGQTKSFTFDASHFLEWTGILIGGQPEQVGWNYLLKSTGSGESAVKAGMNAIVYDKINYRLSEKSGKDTCGYSINFNAANYVGGSSGSTSAEGAFTNYTLLYDNVDPYLSSDAQQGDVLVALEFVNHLGQDFWGQQGLIRDGATFYLFARLTPTPQVADAESFWTNMFANGGNNNNYLLPPYNNTGTRSTNASFGVSRPIRRVFVQDVKTGVTFRFGKAALSHAYVDIPDLRSAKISLGMAVDLNWTSGLTYETQLGTR